MKNYSFEEYLNMINEFVMSQVPETDELYGVISAAMSYSLESGGKRIRPVLALEFCRISGGEPEQALNYASGVEFIHTYSLIHDDLPCMDNDSVRRGKPSSHIKFGEATALLAGDALLTHAFSCLASSSLPSERTVRAVGELASFAGANGMIGGQIVDMTGEKKKLSLDELFIMDKMKTAALIKSACVLGCIASGNDDNIEYAKTYAENLGIAFQIIDDILDYLEGENNSDAVSGKSTYVSLLGLEKARSTASFYTDNALAALDSIKGDTSFLRQLSEKLLKRNA